MRGELSTVAKLGLSAAGDRPRVDPLARRALLTAVALAVVASVVIAGLHEAGRLDLSGLRLQPGWLTLAVAGFAALQLAHARLWRLLMSSLHSPLEARRALSIWCVSSIARYVPTSMLMP